MALLTRKKGAKEDTPSQSTTAAGSKAPKRKLRENERLRSVLKESTFGAAIETLERNIRFRLVPDASGNPRWLALLLHAESIGGLSEKTKRDEAKGSLVQQIISDQIEAITTEQMLAREFFAIVPSKLTLERMGEYSLLANATYYWIVFSSVDGELRFDQNIGPATYRQALAIQNGTSIQEEIENAEGGADTWARIEIGAAAAAADTTADAAAAAQSAPAAVGALDVAARTGTDDEIFRDGAVAQVAEHVLDESALVVDEIPAFDPDIDDADDFYTSLEAGNGGDAGFDELAELPEGVDDDLLDGDVPNDFGDEAPEPVYEETEEKTPHTQYLEHNKARQFSEQQMRESVAPRFLAEELDLEVELSEFDKAFGRADAPKVNVSELIPVDNTDWLGSQVAQMAGAANSELEALHHRHDQELRQSFIDLTSRHIQEVIRQVSLNDTTAKFGKMMGLATKDREKAVKESHSTVVRRRQEIDQRFNEEAEAAAAAAAAQVRAAHIQMNRGRRDTALAQVDRDVAQDIETKYENERQQILRMRRADAELGLQQGKTLIHEALASIRQEQSEAEARLLTEWNARLLLVVDQNRKADIVRAEALAENLSRTNAIEQEHRLSAERIEAMRVDHAERVAHLESRVQQIQQEALVKLRRAEADWQHQLGESNRVIQELQEQMKNLSDSIREQYEERMEVLRESRNSAAEELEMNNKATGRLHKVLILVMVVLVVAALTVGGIAGWVIALKFSGELSTQSLGATQGFTTAVVLALGS